MATLTVTTNADSGTGSLRQALLDAANGDTITFAAALAGTTITLASGYTVNSNLSYTDEITIVGLTDSDGNPAIEITGSDTYSFFKTNLYFNNITVENLKFTHFSRVFSFSHASIDFNTSFTNCHFLNNTRGNAGGAISVQGPSSGSSSLSLTSCVFKNNKSTVNGNFFISGGAIYYSFASLNILNCSFLNNETERSDGGAICVGNINSQHLTTITNSVFTGNKAGNSAYYYTYGGAINVKKATIKHCVFTNNSTLSSNSYGGAINANDTLSLEDCLFDGNSATSYGNDVSLGNINGSTLELLGGNVFKNGVYINTSSSSSYYVKIYGYNGISDYSRGSVGSVYYSGSGFIALPASVSITLPSTVTRSEYGAGVSNFTSSGDNLTWSSTDSTKTVLLEKDNAVSWMTLSSSASSPYVATDNGTYRIWDGSTFLTYTKLGPQTLIVTTSSDSGAGSLRAVLAEARDVDTITFDASLSGSTITLASGLTLTNAATIVGLVDASGDPAITISGANTYRILSGNYKMTLSNLGFIDAGDHAIYNEDANGSTFTNCVFSGNSATDTQGGAVYLEGNNTSTELVTFTDCVFSGNTSVFGIMEGNAGAIYANAIGVTATNCDFTNNVAEGANGGAIKHFAYNAPLTLNNCEFTGNSVAAKSASTGNNDSGGAIYAGGQTVANNCTFTGNSVDNPYDGDIGGAVSVVSGATFTNCSFTSNSASSSGGAVDAFGGGCTFYDCTFSGNTAPNGADFYALGNGALSVTSGIVTIPDVYTSSNSRILITDGAALSVSNSATILGRVQATTRAYLATPPGTDLTGATLTNIVSCDYGAGVSAFSIDEDSADWTAVNSNISVLLEKKINGAWQTLAQPTGTSYSTTFVNGDEARIFDGVQFRTASAVVPQTLIVTNTNPTGAGSLAQAVLDARAVDTITFDASLAGETITLNAGLGPRNEVTIVGLTNDDGTPAITVDGNGNYTFNSSYPVHVSNVAFNGGWGAFSSSGGFDGSTFENCTFENMDLNVFELSNSSQTAESVSFTDCIFTSNDAADMLITGAVNATLSGGNVLTEGFNLTDAGTVVITNSGYNGVGAYTAPSGGTASVAGSGHIALPDAATITIAQTVTRSEFGAGVSSFAADGLTLSWTATDSTKSVLLEVENGADWDTVDDDATSPATVSAVGTYRVWDGVAFFSTSVEPEPAIAVRPGRRVCQSLQFDYTNEGAETIDAGTAIKIGSAFGVIETAILPGATGTVTTLGTWFIPCLDTTVADFGDVAYWDDENQRVTSNDSGTMRIGLFVKPVSSDETEATVMIFPAAPVNGESSSSEESGSGD